MVIFHSKSCHWHRINTLQTCHPYPSRKRSQGKDALAMLPTATQHHHVQKIWIPKMVCLQWNILLKWMVWGYRQTFICILLHYRILMKTLQTAYHAIFGHIMPYLTMFGAMAARQEVDARGLPSSSEILRERKPWTQQERPRTATAALEDAGEAKGKCGVHPVPQLPLETDPGILWELHTLVCIPICILSHFHIHMSHEYISCY